MIRSAYDDPPDYPEYEPDTYVVVDFDGCLTDNSHRFGAMKAGDWTAYSDGEKEDGAHEDVCSFVRTLGQSDVGVIVISGRPKRFEQSILTWFKTYGIFPDRLFMRPEGFYGSEGALKLMHLEGFFGDKKTVLETVKFAIDDSDAVAACYREYGIKCWTIR